MIILDQINQTQCVNCQTVTTSDGIDSKTVWVCENCGEANQPVATTTPEAPVSATPEPTVVSTPEIPEAVDVSTAQAELDQAASQLGNQPVDTK